MTTVRERSVLPLRDGVGTPSTTGPMLAGSLAIALLLFGTRWGSYIGYNGVVLLSDVLMTFAVLRTVIRSARGNAALRPDVSSRSAPWALAALGGYAVLRFVLGGDFSFAAIRDGAPYIYVLLGLLGFYAVRRATAAQRARTAKLFVVALAAHAIWYTVVLALPDLPTYLPLLNETQGVYVFSQRPDVDCALIGVLAAYLLWRALRFRRYVPLLVVLYIACWLPIALSLSRAGLLGAVVASGFVLLLMLTDRRRPPLNRIAVGFVVVVAALLGAGLVLSSDVGSKFIATVDPTAGTAATNEGEIGQGTARARSNAWNHLVAWDFEDAGRATVGVGFGPDFLRDSGSTVLLVGAALDEDVTPRSPHNYWLGSLSRLGTIGLALLVATIAITLWRAWRSRSLLREDGFALIVASIVYSLILPASFGVVLESPFGAMPFWWSVGCVLGLATMASARPPKSGRPGFIRR
ncbi:O-antigen ligase family protein [uncultured Amnibacterium sp.]|uniref:O-antigen ligase family protein n=1 Tax=uncultured Amnibacterium sp. TaxID=1631851 RepID=UPI0035CC1174